MNLKINQILFISIDQGKNFQFKTRVADFTKNSISVEMPIDINSGKFKLISVGTPVKVTYVSYELGQFTFESKIVAMRKEQVPILVIEYPLEYERIQRRDYLRVQASVELSIKAKEKQDWQVTRAIDISGGGMQVVLPMDQTVSVSEEVEGWLAIPFRNGKIEQVRFEGKVLREKKPNDKANVRWLSIRFLKMNENSREKIIRFCYEKQAETRQKS